MAAIQRIEGILANLESVIQRNNGDFFDMYPMAFDKIRAELEALKEMEIHLEASA